MLLIDKYAYFNKLKNVHPIEKMTLALTLLVFCLSVKDILISLVTFTLMSIIIIFIANIPASYYLKLLLLPGFFLISGLITILCTFTTKNTALSKVIWSVTFGDWTIAITKTNLATAIDLFFIVVSSISCLYFLTLTTPIQVLLAVLRKWKLPPLLIELMELTYRSIFIFMETSLKIYRAQDSRLGYRTGANWLRSLGLLVSSLFVTVFKHSREVMTAMAARGYQEGAPYNDEVYQFSTLNWVLISSFITLIVSIYLLFGGKSFAGPLF